MGARILRLSDTVAALGEARPHRPPLPSVEIRKTVLDLAGVEFCPEVAKRFVDLLDRGDIQGFNEQSFRSALLHAVDFFVPAEVSRVSARELLDLFAGLVDAKDPYTGGHSRRVALLARAVSERMDLSEDVRERSWAAGFLHDMGKVCVPLRVLTKPGKLALEEFRSVQNHTVVGARIARSIPSLQHLSPSCRYHHERWDGTGYPEGISGPRIPLLAQVLAVADSYDAMTSGRAYRASRSHGHAMEEVDRCAGTHFSPRVTGAFLTIPYETFREIQQVDYPLPHRFSVSYQEQFRRRQQALLAAE
jgi:HD-GYP domain-containing protein (c-di-GMP phosphodiesterase class II)